MSTSSVPRVIHVTNDLVLFCLCVLIVDATEITQGRCHGDEARNRTIHTGTI